MYITASLAIHVRYHVTLGAPPLPSSTRLRNLSTDHITFTPEPSNNNDNSLAVTVAGAVAGVVAGLVVCIAVAMLLIIACFIFKKRRNINTNEPTDPHYATVTGPHHRAVDGPHYNVVNNHYSSSSPPPPPPPPPKISYIV